MKEAIIGGLVLSAVTGICFIAYNHPSKYLKFLPWVGVLAFLIMMCLGCWNVAVMLFSHRVHLAGLPFVVEAKPALDAIQSSLYGLLLPWWGMALPGLCFGFMWSLKLITGLKETEEVRKAATESVALPKTQKARRSPGK